MEYLVARKIGIPIFIFIHQDSISEYNAFKKLDFPTDFEFKYLDGINHANFVKEIFIDSNERYLFNFKSFTDINDTLKKQWAGLFNSYLTNFRVQKLKSNSLIPINCYKLFYLRKNIGLTQKNLADRAGISESTVQNLEDVGLHFNRIDTKDFKKTKLSNARKIAEILNCGVANIRAELPDDYLTFYLTYYYRNKGIQNKPKKQGKGLGLFPTKAIVFDFDGTLTHPQNGETTWEKIWLKLGYEINECAKLHQQFSRAKISHRKWCQITEQKFKQKKLDKKILDEISDEIILVDGVFETLKELSDSGITLYVCSGSINYIISRVLGENKFYFEEIKANRFTFDRSGFLKDIIGTKYDFEGKSDYLKQIALENDIQPYEILFVGNSLNDEWAHQSGALTLCVNPRLTNPDQHIQWSYSIRSMSNLSQIKKFINFEY